MTAIQARQDEMERRAVDYRAETYRAVAFVVAVIAFGMLVLAI